MFIQAKNSFYSLMPIENAFWCDLSAFTFLVSIVCASLPLISISGLPAVSVFLFFSLVLPACQQKKKSNIYSIVQIEYVKLDYQW